MLSTPQDSQAEETIPSPPEENRTQEESLKEREQIQDLERLLSEALSDAAAAKSKMETLELENAALTYDLSEAKKSQVGE